MLEIKTFQFSSFQTNTYVVNDGKQVLLIDPACCSQYDRHVLYTYIERQLAPGIPDFQLSIIATHGHLDHLWGAPWACEQWHTPVLMHKADIPMAQAMQSQYNLFGISLQAEPFPIKELDCNQPLFEGMEIIETPGHTPGGICLYWKEEKVLFSGDTLFRCGYGRTDLPGGDIGLLLDSLNKLLCLPADVRVYPGHGDATSIAAEKRYANY